MAGLLELIQALDEYFKEILKDKKNIINRIVKEFNRIYKKKEDNEQYENELMTELAKLKKTREKALLFSLPEITSVRHIWLICLKQ